MKLFIAHKYYTSNHDTDILVRGNITTVAQPVTQVASKNCAPFIKCITRIGKTKTDDPADLDLVMPMYNLLNTVQIILTLRVVYGFISKGKQLIILDNIMMTMMVIKFLLSRTKNSMFLLSL